MVVCTAQSTVAQRVRGLRMGADDWLTKPCHPEELLARVEAVVRRRRRAEAREERAPISAGEVEIRADRFQAYVGEMSVDLTRREFELIELLAAAEGRVLEREEIYQRVWGYAMARGDRSVDVFVRKLRQKLEKASPDWRYIHTHFGVGYRFSPEPSDDAAPAGAGRGRARAAEAAGRRARPRADRGPVARRSRTLRAVSTATMRNVAIVLALAAVVYFVPGGGDAAAIIAALLSTAILAAFVMLAARFYRERRMDILGLPDRWRATLYGALARDRARDGGAAAADRDRRRDDPVARGGRGLGLRAVPRVAAVPRVRVVASHIRCTSVTGWR